MVETTPLAFFIFEKRPNVIWLLLAFFDQSEFLG